MRTDEFSPVAADASPAVEFGSDLIATPGRVFSHPQDVLDHPTLEPAEKRVILASWASDVRAVESEPPLRQLECGAIVRLADILAALRTLDGVADRRAVWVNGGWGAGPMA